MDNNTDNRKTDPIILRAFIIVTMIAVICIVVLCFIMPDKIDSPNQGTGDASISGDGVEKIVVGTWDGGSITLISSDDTDKIAIAEEAADGSPLTANEQLFYQITGNQLEIKPSATYVFNRIFNRKVEKNLRIVIPSDSAFEIIISTKETDIFIDEICANTLRAESTSGTVSISGCSANEISLSSSGGGIFADTLSCGEFICRTAFCNATVTDSSATANLAAETHNGKIELNLSEAPDAAEINASNGEVLCVLPENDGFQTMLNLTEGTVRYIGWPDAVDSEPYTYSDGKRLYNLNSIRSEIVLRNHSSD